MGVAASCKCCSTREDEHEAKDVSELLKVVDAEQPIQKRTSVTRFEDDVIDPGASRQRLCSPRLQTDATRTADSSEADSPRTASPASPAVSKRRWTRIALDEGSCNPNFLANVPVFSRCLSEEDLQFMANNMTATTFQAGETFIKQGDKADSFFVIAQGTVRVLVQGSDEEPPKQVRTMVDGDVFGEAALISGGRRTASLQAETDVFCFSITTQKVQELGLDEKIKFTRRTAVGRECVLSRAATDTSGSSSHLFSEQSSLDDEDEEVITNALQENVNLKHLLPDCGVSMLSKEVVMACRTIKVEKDDAIISQGDEDADTFYIIKSGSFSVTISSTSKRISLRKMKSTEFTSEKKVRVMKPGQSFGELALLYRAPRSATVIACEPSSVWALDRASFKEILRKISLSKSKEYGQYLDGIELLGSLSGAEKRLLTTAFETVYFVKDEIIFKNGDASSCLYVLIDGQVELTDEKDKRKKLDASIAKGSWKYFGQEALISTRPRCAKVVVLSENARALTLERNIFSMLLRGTSESTGTDWFKHIGNVSQLQVMQSMPEDVKEALARGLTQEKHTKGSIIFNKGDASSFFYIVIDGVVELHDGKRSTLIEAVPNAGITAHFGDREIFESRARPGSSKVVSESAEILRLDNEQFIKLLGPYRDIFAKWWNNDNDIKMQDLIMMGLIAQGSFGPVEVCKHRTTGTLYALKTMRKDLIVQKEAQKSIMRERAVWIQLRSPFIVQLHALYNEPLALHYLLEFATSGSLAEVYHLHGFFGSEAHARFYIAGVVIALRHIQKKRFIHRDIKPENVLISRAGHPKLGDFAFAKPLIGKTFTTCGTPEYMAPEILIGTGHTKAVDWWAVGILLFELLAGRPPFNSKQVMQVYSEVMRGIAKVTFPPECEGNVGDLIRKLCKQDPSHRLVSAADAMSHPWYANFDWSSMASQTLEPPFRPLESTGISDAKRKSLANHGVPANCDYKDDGSMWDQGFASNVCLLGSGSGISWTKY